MSVLLRGERWKPAIHPDNDRAVVVMRENRLEQEWSLIGVARREKDIPRLLRRAEAEAAERNKIIDRLREVLGDHNDPDAEDSMGEQSGSSGGSE